jgi:hypothetical protein
MDRTSSGHVRLMQSTEFEGTINAVIAQTNVSDVYIDLLTANNQTPTTTGDDTAWSDNQQHMQSLFDMIANNPERHGLPILYGQTGDYWGDVHTSPEGTVVHEGQILRVNPNRAAFCLDGSGRPYIGKFNEQQLREMGCVTAFGAGPVILKDGKVANPQYNGESNMIPWNPEDEGFANKV